mgnify:FL=1
MLPFVEEENYKTLTDSFKYISGDGTTAAGTELVVIEFPHRAQISNLRITGASSNLYDVVARDQDGTNPEVLLSLVGTDLDEGTFREPAIKNIGAQREVAVINRTQLSDANYGVNIEVDHMLRRVE